MIRLFKHYVPKSLIVLGAIEWAVLALAVELSVRLRYFQANLDIDPVTVRVPQIIVFVLVIYISMLALGLYRSDVIRDLRATAFRLVLAAAVGFAILAMLFFLVRDVLIWRSILAIAITLSFAGILLTRAIFVRLADLDRFKHRVIVVGAADRAARLWKMAEEGELGNSKIVGFLPIAQEPIAVKEGPILTTNSPLTEIAREYDVDEIVLAVTERRGALPLQSLLDCKIAGCQITDYVSFLEKVRGYVDLDTLQPSWLIFSDGFVGGSPHERFVKRTFDILVSLAIFIFSLPLVVMAAVAVKTTSRGPLFYKQERIGQGGRTFKAIKFRSMKVDAEADGVPKWASDEDPRVTPVGRFIRMTRIDELPQIINVLQGEMSFVGPRPERPFFVDSLVSQIPYYNERHHVKPGITGWAQVNFPYGASIEDSKRKLEYDLYYVKNYTIFLDFLILAQTVRAVLWPEGAR